MSDLRDEPHGQLPEIGRTIGGLVLIGTWRVGSTEAQQEAVVAVREAWARVGWPDGLLSHTVFVGSDGTTLVQYSQWANDEHARVFAGALKRDWTAVVDAAVPGLERIGVVPARVHGQAAGSLSGGRPGCVVLVDIETESEEHAVRWLDAMLELGPVDTARTGLRAASFHISIDGRRVINLAEWTDEASHVAAVNRPKDLDEGEIVHETPGVRVMGHRRFLSWDTVSRPPLAG
ncbi:MAG TPA: hypothetical protein VD903_15480 [Pseudonocardia sp.]|nr:hypothetical protein [Pseudonocardia sp.]